MSTPIPPLTSTNQDLCPRCGAILHHKGIKSEIATTSVSKCTRCGWFRINAVGDLEARMRRMSRRLGR